MQNDFPEFDDLERVCDWALDTNAAPKLRALGLPIAALGEALVLSNRKALDLDTAHDARLELLKAAVRSASLCGIEAQKGVFFVRDEDAEVGELCVDFAGHLGKALEAAGLASGPRMLVQGSLVELASNIQQHAGSQPRGYVLYEVSKDCVSISVLDSGQGVVAGYASVSPELASLSAGDALVRAVRDHRSRLEPIEEGRGTGFGTVLRAMKTLDARLRVRSGNASLETASGAGADWVLREQVELSGFVVTLLLAWRHPGT